MRARCDLAKPAERGPQRSRDATAQRYLLNQSVIQCTEGDRLAIWRDGEIHVGSFCSGNGWGLLPMLDPLLTNLHDDPRWEPLLDKMGFLR